MRGRGEQSGEKRESKVIMAKTDVARSDRVIERARARVMERKRKPTTTTPPSLSPPQRRRNK